jgi:predicted DCC family thiol-disulfide oxidoreductase YuxK
MFMSNNMPTVFFDGSCPLCRREIAFYQRQRGADTINWQDVSSVHGDACVAPGLDCTTAMQRFHVRNAHGELKSGAAGFAELWTSLPAFAWAGRLARLPGIVHVLELAYRAFLPLRPRLQSMFAGRDGQITSTSSGGKPLNHTDE